MGLIRRHAMLAAVCGAALMGACSASSAWAAAPASVQVGSQTLNRCAEAPLAYCGSLPVPLDHQRPSGPQISIAFRWYPASASAPEGATHTVVPVEGGPGYPSIESVSYQSLGANAGYSAMYGALLAHDNMLAIDNRGTGESAPLKCAALQHFSGPTGTEAFQQTAAGCADKLNHRWRYPDGSWVHASDLFGSTAAAQDMAEVIRALSLSKVDLYGDSYGSFFAQVFAARFPHLVRSVILDSTYETAGLDPWYRSTVQSMPAAFAAACSRAPACAQAEPEAPWARIGELAARLRAAPISGRVPGPSGGLEKVEMNVVGLVDLVSDAAEDTRIYRGLDAAARALLGPAQDAAPLLRLYAQRESEDEGYFSLPVREYSVELYVADACVDYPQLFDMNASGAQRAGELAARRGRAGTRHVRALQHRPSGSPRTRTPRPSPSASAGPARPSHSRRPTATRLCSRPRCPCSCWAANWTPGRRRSTSTRCSHRSAAMRASWSWPTRRTSSARATPTAALRSCRRSPPARSRSTRSTSAAPPPWRRSTVSASTQRRSPNSRRCRLRSGSSASPAELQAAAVAVQSAGDAISRYQAIEYTKDSGLAGGSAHATHGGTQIELQRYRLVPGVAVSGTLALAQPRIPSTARRWRRRSPSRSPACPWSRCRPPGRPPAPARRRR